MWIKVFLLVWLMILSISDIKCQKISLHMIVAFLVTAFGILIFQMGKGNAVLSNVAMGLIPGVGWLFVALGTGKAGWADGVVLSAIGLWVGCEECILIFLISLFLAFFYSAVLLCAHKATRKTKIPYLPFLTLGCLALYVWK